MSFHDSEHHGTGTILHNLIVWTLDLLLSVKTQNKN